jgi:CubicO group peptidase (beta-lactamase class C family)
LVAISLAIGVNQPAKGQTALSQGDHAARIAHIEQSLPPAVIVRGLKTPDRSLAEAMAEVGVPGLSVAYVRGGRIVWSRQYGVKQAGGAPVGPETRFQAGSISKSIAAIGAMALVESGAISLDDDVNTKLRSWRLPVEESAAGAPVTLTALLSHTAGTTVRGFPGYRTDEIVPTLLQVLDGMPPSNTKAVRVTTRPGETYSYSGGGYEVVQQLIEDVTETRFQDWIAAKVFAPAGMSHSGYEQRLSQAQIAYHAMAHDGRGSVVEAGPYIYPEQAAAGLWSTPEDLALALIALQRALSGAEGETAKASARRMLMEVKPGRALGFDVGGSAGARWFSKGGDTQGFGAFMVAFESGDCAVVMANGANGAALAHDVVRGIAVAYAWDAFKPRERTAVTLNIAQTSRLEGHYRYSETGEFIVKMIDGRLSLSSPGEKPETAYAASANELFGLSQDAAFIFERSDGPAQKGHIQLGSSQLPFWRIE